MESLSERGVLKIRWDKKMKLLKEDVKNAIPDTTYVLIEDADSSSSRSGRRLATREWFDTEEDYI